MALLRLLFQGLALGILGTHSRAQAAPVAPPKAPVDWVDPFLGTAGDGNVYPGATVPFGFIQVGPDTGPGSWAGGYKFTKNIDGFSQQHISGMGGPLFGEISVLPMTGALQNPSNICSTGKSAETATPGYYAVTLAPWNVRVELTATRHVALHRHTFPAHAQSRVLVDVGHVLYGTGAGWSSAKPIGGEVNVDAAAREVSGFMEYQGGRSTRKWKVYFATRFDTPFGSSGTWDDAGTLTDGAPQRRGSEIGAYLNFATKQGQVVNSKVAVSYRSVEQARGYFAEVPKFDFDRARQAARAEWSKALNTIQVEGGTDAQRQQFYTALYRVHLTPNDWTGEAPAAYGNQPYYENLLCLWDTFRTPYPLLTLIQPKVQTDIVNSIIGYYTHNGWTGDAHSAWAYEHVQNGSNADVIIADAYVKKLPGIDWKTAYQAIRKNAFEDDNPTANYRPQKGRYHLNDYRRYHHVPTDIGTNKDVQAVSRTLEYVYDDYAVWTLAKDLGTPEDVADLQSRLRWYQNLWHPETGFMRGKTRDGNWHAPFDPLLAETGRQYYEGHAWTWSWYVPHDTQGLINLLGGNPAFVEKLTTAVDQHYEAYNEPGMLQTYLFTHAGRPDLTQFHIRKALGNFATGPAGLPGNDDSGTTSAWLVWAMLGIYPNAGQDFYYFGSPTFTKVTIRLGNGKQIVINAPASSATAKYISQATRNGKAWNNAWFRHRDISNGAEFTLSMSDQPAVWGRDTPPPSLSARP
ncbi:GH92 family glycosyl hydrolase [Hymenobacter terrenus]|uniref:GH92 family glycosyl hydrolase n=1 Tax=Hymenobacter terrenus TaxID=1629124 RepID=UPI00061994CD|nr:GH92 family glycosyl hydrolase [Hymenobacter terrenus]